MLRNLALLKRSKYVEQTHINCDLLFNLNSRFSHSLFSALTKNSSLDATSTGGFKQQTAETVREVKHHDDLAADWWNKNGPMAALHAMNEIRQINHLTHTQLAYLNNFCYVGYH